jgi:hypothetical protein
MPGKDGTGPMGSGPNGWGRGPCGSGQGRGQGRGRGMGRGMGGGNRFGQGGSYDPRLRGNWFDRIWGQQSPGPEPVADRMALEQQIRMLEDDLQAARQQLEAMGPVEKE